MSAPGWKAENHPGARDRAPFKMRQGVEVRRGEGARRDRKAEETGARRGGVSHQTPPLRRTRHPPEARSGEEEGGERELNRKTAAKAI